METRNILLVTLMSLCSLQSVFSQSSKQEYQATCVLDVPGFSLFSKYYYFAEGHAFVRYDGKWGAINTSGKQSIPFKYDDADFHFCDGLGSVQLDGKWGFLNKQGTLVIPCKYTEVGNFNDGVARVKINGKWGAINKTGILVVPAKYDKELYFSEGIADVVLNGKYGYVNKQGTVIVPPKFEEANSFSEGFAVVKQNGKYGYINRQGTLVIPLSFDDAKSFSEGLAAVRKGEAWGYINSQGKVIIPFAFSSAESFRDGLALVKPMRNYDGSTDDKKAAAALLSLMTAFMDTYIDKTGKPIAEGLIGENHDGLFSICSEKKYGYKDKQGNLVIPYRYEYADYFSEGFACVKLYGKKGYVNKQGKEITSFVYDDGSQFSEGLARVKKNGKYGFINSQGKEITPFVFDWAENFSNGFACVEIDDKLGFIDKNGKALDMDFNGEIDYKIGEELDYKLDNKNLTETEKKQIQESAFAWFKKGAIKDDPSCCYALGFYYRNGIIVEKNYAEAVKWFTKATKMKNPNGVAHRDLGYCYNEGGYGIAKDDVKAFNYFLEGAKYKHQDCYYALAVSYLKGIGCSKTPRQACTYAEKLYGINKTNYASLYAQCYNALAYDYANKKDYTQALNAIDKAIGAGSDINETANYYDSKGEIYLMMGKENEALKMWRKVVELDSENIDFYKQHSELYKKLSAKGKI